MSHYSAKARLAFQMVGATILAPLALAPMAFAETPDGTRNTYISGWHAGTKSQNWKDPDQYDGRTRFSHFATCELEPEGLTLSSITYQFVQDRGLLPDPEKGRGRMPCQRTGSLYFGRPAAATYYVKALHLTVKQQGDINSWGEYSVNDVRIRW